MTNETKAKAKVLIELEVAEEDVVAFLKEWDDTVQHLIGMAGVVKAVMEVPETQLRTIELARY